jgi:RNase H-like domain found in reverse transcriptase/Reverse transcriptase (RNA-dependent DNA polymerase)/Integrase zinc binding domain/Chromo (CHRromatin Organisation MOdifier) domain/Integrase core domain/Retroviral aspartyl protease
LYANHSKFNKTQFLAATELLVSEILTREKEDFPDIVVDVQTVDTGVRFKTRALLDSGAAGLYVDWRFVEKHQLETKKLDNPILVFNVDGTQNKEGEINRSVDLRIGIQDHYEQATFMVTDLGKKSMIIGINWLKAHNPEIDWHKGEFVFSRCPAWCGGSKGQTQPRADSFLKPDIIPKRMGNVGTQADEDKSQNEHYIPDDSLDSREFIRQADIHYINAAENHSTRLAREAQVSQTHTTLEDILQGPYASYADIFEKKDFDELPPNKKWDHAIELKSDFKPFKAKMYPLNPEEQKHLQSFLEENLKSGRIRVSKSPIASPFFFVKKKDGALRPVQDYRLLNEGTIKNNYPLPLMSEIIDNLRGAKFFSKLDVRWGYNNIRIKEGDEYKAAFLTNQGLFEPTVMFFGLTNSPATFQTMMNEIFQDLIWQKKVIVYMDDILIFAKSIDQLRDITKEVLEILRRNKLFLKPEKCTFEKKQIEYLGMIISENQVEMDPIKVAGVSEWPIPKTLREVRSFLGFLNFYRRFIEGFSEIARPLHDLMKKDVQWKWNEETQTVFEILKWRVTSAPILVTPDPERPKKIEADSSNYAVGAVLSQLEDDGRWHPVAFISSSLQPAERNYEIYDKEMLAIIRAFEHWRQLLLGNPHVIEVYTDHKNLEYYRHPHKLSRRQARWASKLTEYDFKLYHKPGTSMGLPDALSRRADHDKGNDDNREITMLKPEHFVNSVIIESTLLDEIRRKQQVDPHIGRILKIKESEKDKVKEWLFHDDLWMYDNRIYAPEGLRYRIVQERHDTPGAGHPGKNRTFEIIAREFWWPGMRHYIDKYVKGCDKCQRTKTFPAKPFGKLTPNEIPTRPWQIVSVDLIVGLPESQGYDSIMVVVDRFSKMIRLAPCTQKITSMGVARLFRDNVWRSHGLPEKIISDRGSQFSSEVMREMNRLLGIETALSTAYHPQTDGQTERINQHVEGYIRLYTNYQQSDWVDWLPMAEFSYNNHMQASSRNTPFMINYGRNPRMGFETRIASTKEAVEEFLTRMKAIWDEAEASLKSAAIDMKKYYDRKRQDEKDIILPIGSRVLLDATNLRTERPSRKLSDKRLGPYKVLEKRGAKTYKLELPKSMKIHPVFDVKHLRPYVEENIAERKAMPVPDPVLIDGEPEWEVEEILDSKFRGKGKTKKLYYKVRWKDYPLEESTWESETAVENAPDVIKEFHKKYPNSPKRINALEFSSLPWKPLENFTTTDSFQTLPWEQGLCVSGRPTLTRG